MTVLYIIIYLLGSILSYISLRKYFRKTFNEWRILDRRLGILFSTLSWLSLLASLILTEFSKDDNNEPANW